MAIRSFRHKGLRLLFEAGDARGVRPDLVRRCEQRLRLMHEAEVIDELSVPGWRLHPLRGEPRWAIAVNGPWRITFAWDGKDFADVDREQ